jgi:hypothetical protein
MAATRRQPPLQIFQDPIAQPDHHEVAAYEPRLLSAFKSVTDVSSDHHTLLQPPDSHLDHAQSPRKTRHVSSSPPPAALSEKGLNTISIPPPHGNAFRTDSPVKKIPRPVVKQTGVMGSGRAPIFSTFPAQFDKENMYSMIEDQRMPLNLPAELPTKPAPKRGLMEPAPLRDRSKKQKVKEPVVEEVGPLPEPDEMPPVMDDGSNTKPPFSYAHLIGMAILRAPNRRLTLAQIYKWISDTFQYYRDTSEMGWQNSIRHNLSLSKAFSKQERPKDDPGKGHYWRINPGFEQQFYKVKTARRPTNPDNFMPAYPIELARPPTAASSSFPLPPTIVKSIDSSKFPEETELSSDATIPCSDPAPHEGQEAEHHMPPPRHIPSSPPPADIQSSPPAPAPRSLREGTPPRIPRIPSHSRSGGRKRKFNVFGDSGYYSSIESSAVKGGMLGTLLTSEADLERPSIKRGRAEEEIARIRGSSYDSPSKARPYMKQPSAAHMTSSPFRADPPIDPLTPAVVFKRPALPPASASPNTNLRNHRNRMRELIGGSPDKSMAVLSDTSFLHGLSPAVQMPDDESVNVNQAGFDSTFDVFGDYHYLESPTKPSAKRPRLERAATTTGILADITGLSNSRVSTPVGNWKSPFLNMPSFQSPARNESPMKAPTSNPLPEFTLSKPDSTRAIGLTPPQTFDMPEDNLFIEFHSDDSEEAGFDLTQTFPRIGATVAPNGSPSKPSRPALSRSSSTRF